MNEVCDFIMTTFASRHYIMVGHMSQFMRAPVNDEFAKSGTETPPQRHWPPQLNMRAQYPRQWVPETQCGSHCACRVDGFCETRKTKPSECRDNGSGERNIQCICRACSPRFAG